MEYDVCTDCEHKDPFYGCMDQDCEVYVDMQADIKNMAKKDLYKEEGCSQELR